MTLDISLRKTDAGQKRLSFLWQKKWSKVNATIKNAKILASFMQDNCPKEKYLTSSAKIS